MKALKFVQRMLKPLILEEKINFSKLSSKDKKVVVERLESDRRFGSFEPWGGATVTRFPSCFETIVDEVILAVTSTKDSRRAGNPNVDKKPGGKAGISDDPIANELCGFIEKHVM